MVETAGNEGKVAINFTRKEITKWIRKTVVSHKTFFLVSFKLNTIEFLYFGHSGIFPSLK